LGVVALASFEDAEQPISMRERQIAEAVERALSRAVIQGGRKRRPGPSRGQKAQEEEPVYSPQIHEDVARHRQADMLREARRERLAATAAAARREGLGKLAHVSSVFARVSAPVRALSARAARIGTAA
jgi:hypothetical protein